jgi:GNAT superfamily N-acetyltransferase
MANRENILHIRPAAEPDYSALAELYRHLIPNDIPAPIEEQTEAFEAMLSHPGLNIIVGCLADHLVTTCTLVVVPNFTRGCAPYALIENVVTHTDHRGSGFGERILKAAFDAAWRAGCYKIMLMSGIKNTDAHRFYERIGLSSTKQGFEMRAPGYPQRALT